MSALTSRKNSVSILCIFRLIYKPQVKRRQIEDFHLITLTSILIVISQVCIISTIVITFRQVLESSSSLAKAGKVSISEYHQL